MPSRLKFYKAYNKAGIDKADRDADFGVVNGLKGVSRSEKMMILDNMLKNRQSQASAPVTTTSVTGAKAPEPLVGYNDTAKPVQTYKDPVITTEGVKERSEVEAPTPAETPAPATEVTGAMAPPAAASEADVNMDYNRARAYNARNAGQMQAIQNALIKAGYNVGGTGADGKFGNNTYNAIREFQKAKGLTVDGKIGANTLKALGITSTTPETPVTTGTIKPSTTPVNVPIYSVANYREELED